MVSYKKTQKQLNKIKLNTCKPYLSGKISTVLEDLGYCCFLCKTNELHKY